MKNKGDGDQYLLPFEFLELERERDERERKVRIQALRTFDNARDDNEKLFNLQKAFYEGDPAALQKMYLKLDRLAVKLVNKECNKNKIFFTEMNKRELATDAATLFIEQVLKNDLMIQDSFIAYLYLQVRKVLYHRTKSQMLEDYCRKHNINLFSLTDDEKQRVKKKVEKLTKEGEKNR